MWILRNYFRMNRDRRIEQMFRDLREIIGARLSEVEMLQTPTVSLRDGLEAEELARLERALRTDELRELGDRIAVLGYQRYGQHLVLTKSEPARDKETSR